MGTTIDGYRASVDGVKWFAYFFLEGQVYPKLKRFVLLLLTTPGSITVIGQVDTTYSSNSTNAAVAGSRKYKLLEIWGLDEKCEILIYKIIFRYYHRVDFYTILDR
ncbi:uncharacterized protein LOC143906026 [Temnothorax americanus]|uniref:uncharacterized protein LOC143906026 n=1 Tax=Temnothorax americanus TaxID=1964332 RepID=UPI0040684203